VAGCGAPRSSPAPSATGQDTTRLAPAFELAPDGLRAVSIYFSGRNGDRLVPVTRYVLPDSGLARGALLALLAGPAPEEDGGSSSAVPAGTRLLGLVVRDSAATVDLSREYESGAGSAAVRMRLAQLTYTLTRLPGVRRVRLRLEGRFARPSARRLPGPGALR
jgi:spore germination protein GerM